MEKNKDSRSTSPGSIPLLKLLLLPLIILFRLCFSAKVKAPLFGLGASGQLGKAIVYFTWKGIDVVRSHVVPSNPKTSGQTTQRGYITAAVAAIHAAQARPDNPLDEDDISAYSLWGSIYAKPRTWFNQVCKMWADVKVAGDTPCIYTDGAITDKDASAIDAFLKLNEETGSTLAAGKFYFGTSKTALVHSAAASITAGDKAVLEDEDLSAFLTVGVKYFWQFRPNAGDGCEGALSGIYYFVAE